MNKLELPPSPITVTFRDGSRAGQQVTVDLHRVYTWHDKQTGERWFRVTEPSGTWFVLASEGWMCS